MASQVEGRSTSQPGIDETYTQGISRRNFLRATGAAVIWGAIGGGALVFAFDHRPSQISLPTLVAASSEAGKDVLVPERGDLFGETLYFMQQKDVDLSVDELFGLHFPSTKSIARNLYQAADEGRLKVIISQDNFEAIDRYATRAADIYFSRRFKGDSLAERAIATQYRGLQFTMPFTDYNDRFKFCSGPTIASILLARSYRERKEEMIEPAVDPRFEEAYDKALADKRSGSPLTWQEDIMKIYYPEG